MTTGAIIKGYRERMGLSQEIVAAFLNVKRENISYWENDSREVSLENLEKLADLFGIDLIDFYETDQHQVEANIAFAFRADGLVENDLEQIAQFRKVVKNYIKLVELEKNA